MAEIEVRHIDVDELRHDMQPPTADDVPMTSDWKPLDTRAKLIEYLARINEDREQARVP
ncbi:MAG TPA: hypothetical protein VES40_03720 [Ilumatobacteraceae bacterium]|nr:hypothetical protein [Ilumatobacteraceae bacterium]